MATWILLEDEIDVQEMMLAMVDMLGAQGMSFSDGTEAVRWIGLAEAGEYDGEMPELALLDIRMPDAISGPEVATRLRRSPLFKDIVIVLMTAYRLSLQDEEAIMRRAGANFLLYKPLPSIDELGYVLNGLLLSR